MTECTKLKRQSIQGEDSFSYKISYQNLFWLFMMGSVVGFVIEGVWCVGNIVCPAALSAYELFICKNARKILEDSLHIHNGVYGCKFNCFRRSCYAVEQKNCPGSLKLCHKIIRSSDSSRRCRFLCRRLLYVSADF